MINPAGRRVIRDRDELLAEREVSPGNPPGENPACPGKRHGQGEKGCEQKQREGEQARAVARGLTGQNRAPSAVASKPEPEGEDIDELDPEGGHVELPQENHLAQNRDESDDEQNGFHRAVSMSVSLKTSAWNVRNWAPFFQLPAGSPAFRHS